MMAETRRAYRADRNAYQYGYHGNAATIPQEWEERAPKRKPAKRKRRAAQNDHLQVREAGKVAPVAVVGLLAACLMIVIMLSQFAGLMMVNNEAVAFRKELALLKTNEAKLTAQYELSYDLQAIETELLTTGAMVKPQSGQTYTIELPRPDGAQYYDNASFGSGLVSGVKEIFSAIASYF